MKDETILNKFILEIPNMHEFELAYQHKIALQNNEYEICAIIQNEVDNRIFCGTISHEFMNGFKWWNPKTEKFEGNPKFTELNKLFSKYTYPILTPNN